MDGHMHTCAHRHTKFAYFLSLPHLRPLRYLSKVRGVDTHLEIICHENGVMMLISTLLNERTDHLDYASLIC